MDEAETDDPVGQAQYVDINHYLPGDILTKVDRASMAQSLEVRAPLLDHRLVEWALSLPQSLKLRGRSGKYILSARWRRGCRQELLYRRKQGFATSLAGLFAAKPARLRSGCIGAMQDSGLFEAGAIGPLLDEHPSGRFDHSMALWQLLVFEGFLASEMHRGDRLPEPAIAVPA